MNLAKIESETRAALERARKADDEASKAQERATAAYDGSDRLYKPVEAADAARRRTSLDLALAEKAHAAAEQAIREHNRAELLRECDELRAYVSERAQHGRLSGIIDAIRELDRQLCVEWQKLAHEVNETDRRVRRLESIEAELAGGEPRDRKADRRSMYSLAMLTSALVGADRRARKDPAPVMDPSVRYVFGDLPESLITTRRPAGFSDIEQLNADKEAARYLSNTAAKAEKAA